MLITFLKIATDGGQNLLNLKASNPPAPLSKGSKGKGERLRFFKNKCNLCA
ncbi:MAG: hypothetical protein ACYCT7_01565 [bacterium]